MKRPRSCAHCDTLCADARAHALHLADVHPDKVGCTTRARRPWSCWHCARENSSSSTTCVCGFDIAAALAAVRS